MATYEDTPGINWSTLKHMAESPAHYRAALREPGKDTDALAIGRAFHCLVLEPFEFSNRFAIWPEASGQRRGKAWEAFCAEAQAYAEPKTILREQDLGSIRAMAAAVHDHPAFATVCASERPAVESTLVWTDEETGLRCKGRADYIGPDTRVLVDLKSTMTTHAKRFGSAAARLAYHGQFAHYAAGVRAKYGFEPRCYIIAVEKTRPFDVAVFEVLPDDLRLGEALRRDLLTKLVECQRTDTWPTRSTGILPLQLPAWAYADDALTREDYGDDDLDPASVGL